MKTANETVTITLEVARVGNGGNTGAGKYFYNFSPDIVNVTRTNTLLAFELSPDTPPQFRFSRFFSTDSLGQLSPAEIVKEGRRLEVLNANTREYLIVISILVEDTREKTLINCDPQVTNIPE